MSFHVCSFLLGKIRHWSVRTFSTDDHVSILQDHIPQGQLSLFPDINHVLILYKYLYCLFSSFSPCNISSVHGGVSLQRIKLVLYQKRRGKFTSRHRLPTMLPTRLPPVPLPSPTRHTCRKSVRTPNSRRP